MLAATFAQNNSSGIKSDSATIFRQFSNQVSVIQQPRSEAIQQPTKRRCSDQNQGISAQFSNQNPRHSATKIRVNLQPRSVLLHSTWHRLQMRGEGVRGGGDNNAAKKRVADRFPNHPSHPRFPAFLWFFVFWIILGFQNIAFGFRITRFWFPNDPWFWFSSDMVFVCENILIYPIQLHQGGLGSFLFHNVAPKVLAIFSWTCKGRHLRGCP